MVVKENEMNIYGQRKFESVMVLRYIAIYIYVLIATHQCTISVVLYKTITWSLYWLQVWDKSDTT